MSYLVKPPKNGFLTMGLIILLQRIIPPRLRKRTISGDSVNSNGTTTSSKVSQPKKDDKPKPAQVCFSIINRTDVKEPSVGYNQNDLCRENLSSGFPTRLDTNQAMQPQRMVRGLKLKVTVQLVWVFAFAYAKTGFLMKRLS